MEFSDCITKIAFFRIKEISILGGKLEKLGKLSLEFLKVVIGTDEWEWNHDKTCLGGIFTGHCYIDIAAPKKLQKIRDVVEN